MLVSEYNGGQTYNNKQSFWVAGGRRAGRARERERDREREMRGEDDGSETCNHRQHVNHFGCEAAQTKSSQERPIHEPGATGIDVVWTLVTLRNTRLFGPPGVSGSIVLSPICKGGGYK